VRSNSPVPGPQSNLETVDSIRAVTFDFFQTLVHHRLGDGGRGRALVAYLRSLGIEPEPWDHQILYDVLEPHGREYSPELSPLAKQTCFVEVARRLFERMDVSTTVYPPRDHASSFWELIGPRSLELYPDVRRTMVELRERGYRLAVVSNWQCGLSHFCAELGIGEYYDHIVASAEIGHAKPGSAIFEEATNRLGLAPSQVLHVGDSMADDVVGARAAGLNAVLLDRKATRAQGDPAVVTTLPEILDLL
jgi:HAD superfamily hydrolase (TIGR01549 family)